MTPTQPPHNLKTKNLSEGAKSTVVLWPRLPKVALFGPQNHFFEASLKNIVTIMTGHLKANLLVLTALQGDLRGAVQVLFGPKIAPKKQIFYTLPI